MSELGFRVVQVGGGFRGYLWVNEAGFEWFKARRWISRWF